MTTTDNRKFRDFEEWYDAEAEASELLFQTWVDEGITDDPTTTHPSPDPRTL
ncbi:hypothetical protein AcW2_000035 [Taiwanofungus camphoratus]|nr:hypothetical protein AcW2_000035 [Antrodia cinnamomea]